MTLPSVRWGLFIRGVSRLSFIVAALSFLPSFLPLHLPSFQLLSILSLYISVPSLSLSSPSPLSISPPVLVRGTYYILALTYSGLMPVVVLPSPNLPFTPSNEHCLPTAPAGSPLFFRPCLLRP